MIRPRKWLTRPFRAIASAVFIVIGVAAAVTPMGGPPAAYARLSAHGIRVPATFLGCTGFKPQSCRLALRRDGKTRTWIYPQDYAQFSHLPVGAPVPVLVDPTDSFRVYTVHDVDTRYNPGFGGRRGVGIAVAVLGAGGFVSAFWRRRRRRR